MQSFKEFYIQWYSRSVLFAMEFVKDSHDAKDIVQETFINIYEKWPIFDEGMNIIPYLLTSVKNRCINYLKTPGRKRTQYLDDKEGILNEVNLKALEEFDTYFPDEASIEKRLDKAIEALPPRCREIFIRSKIRGESHAQIAKEMSISENTIESQMTIAYRKLKDELKGCELLLLLFLII